MRPIIRSNVLRLLVLFSGVILGGTLPAAAQEPPNASAALTGTAYRLVEQAFVDGVVVDETAALLREAGLADRFDNISTGGGAFLEYLEGRELPGVAALQDA